MNNKTIFITGVTGQDGSYLSEIMLDKGYDVYGLVRRLSKPNTSNIDHIIDDIYLVEGDMLDQSSLSSILRTIQPDEIYNMAAQSFVATSWAQPILTGEITGLGAVRLFEAVKNECESSKVYQASSSEQFGKVNETPQTEDTPFYPRSPYACSKCYAHHMAINYRESYNIFITCGILFNHESPRRGIEFVTKKIARGISDIVHKKKKYIELGNIESRRDWGYSKEYMEAVYKIMQLKNPETVIISTNEQHSVREFLDEAFDLVGLSWGDYTKYNINQHIRPSEVNTLQGNYSKANKLIGYEPKVKFKELVKIMVDYELNQSI